MKHPQRPMYRAAVVLMAALWLGPAGSLQAKNATPAQFADQKQTQEYHFMLLDRHGLTQDALKNGLPAAWINQIEPMFTVDPKGKLRQGMYVDSADGILEKQNLILRVREGDITIKARSLSPESVIDIEKCSAKKYEVDFFSAPEYSISSDIKFKPEEYDTTYGNVTPQNLLTFVAQKCPALADLLKPALQNPDVRIPGAAYMYHFDIKINHALAEKFPEAGFTVWFFPPTAKMLVEIAFTGSVKDRIESDKLHADILQFLKERNLLDPDQSSKTAKYFKAYFGKP